MNHSMLLATMFSSIKKELDPNTGIILPNRQEGVNLHNMWSRHMGMSADGNVVVRYDGIPPYGRVIIYEGGFSNWKTISHPEGYQTSPSSFGQGVALSYNGEYLAIGNPYIQNGGAIHFYRKIDGSYVLLNTITGASFGLNNGQIGRNLQFSDDGQILIASGQERFNSNTQSSYLLKFERITDGTYVIHQYLDLSGKYHRSSEITPDGKFLLLASPSSMGDVRLYQRDPGVNYSNFTPVSMTVPVFMNVECASMSSDARVIAVTNGSNITGFIRRTGEGFTWQQGGNIDGVGYYNVRVSRDAKWIASTIIPTLFEAGAIGAVKLAKLNAQTQIYDAVKVYRTNTLGLEVSNFGTDIIFSANTRKLLIQNEGGRSYMVG